MAKKTNKKQMDTEGLKQGSETLARVMDDIGVNEEIISLRHHVSLVLDIYTSANCSSKRLTFGSQSEGSTTIGMMSDTDTLFYSEINVACVHLSDCQDLKNNFFVIKEPTSLPQCCCLQPVEILENNINLPMRRDSISNTENTGKKIICDQQGRLLLNSLFCSNAFHLVKHTHRYDCTFVQHGPALTLNDRDHVFAIRCMTYPDNCKYLFTRTRPGHWPTHATLSQAEHCEVFMVYPGNLSHTFGYDHERRVSFIKLQYQKKYIESQFRMSTNMTERLLMFKLNIVQMKAYVLTKMIRKEFLKPLVDERLSTFHMKTALFFTIELFPEDIWRNDNLVQCVIYCLTTLGRFLKRGFCPHYTISSVNLFSEKLTKNELQIVKDNVTEMIKSRLRCLRRLCMDDVGRRLSERVYGVKNDYVLSGTEMRFKIIKKMLNTIRDYAEPLIESTYNDLKMDTFAIKSAMAAYQEYKNGLEFMFQMMCSSLASREASDCIANGRKVTSDNISMYETSLRSTDISNHLRYASMLVCTRQFERACALLETIEHTIASRMIQLTHLSEQSIHGKTKPDQRSYKCTECVSEILMEYAAKIIFPVVFVKDEIYCVPEHLIYEMYKVEVDERKWKEFTLFRRPFNTVFKSNANAYLYYLQYLSSGNKDKKRLALSKLSDYCESKLHTRKSDYSALHMLGHVHELENNLPSAWSIYRRSITKQPRNNAAYWHLFRLFGLVVYSALC